MTNIEVTLTDQHGRTLDTRSYDTRGYAGSYVVQTALEVAGVYVPLKVNVRIRGNWLARWVARRKANQRFRMILRTWGAIGQHRSHLHFSKHSNHFSDGDRDIHFG